MKRSVFFLLLVLSMSLNAQNNYIAVEALYLKNVNTQGNVLLIRDNLRNAEMVVDSIVFRGKTGEYSAQVLANLAYSYFLVHDYGLAYLTGLRYFLFCNTQDKRLNDFVKDIMQRSGQKIKIYNIENDISQALSKQDQDQKLEFLLRKGVENYRYFDGHVIMRILSIAGRNGYKIPAWAKQLQFYTGLGFSFRKAVRMIDFNTVDNVQSWIDDPNLNFLQKCRIRFKLRCKK